MELRQLRYFVKVFEMGSITKAAASIPIVQPALTHQLSRLEGELQVKLFLRSSKGVVPTAAGRLLYENIRDILARLEKERLVSQLRGRALPLKGMVTLGLAPTTASALGLKLLEVFRWRHPGVVLNVVESISSHLEELLVARKLDLAILFTTLQNHDISHERLFEERFFLIAKKTRVKIQKQKISLRDAGMRNSFCRLAFSVCAANSMTPFLSKN